MIYQVQLISLYLLKMSLVDRTESIAKELLILPPQQNDQS